MNMDLQEYNEMVKFFNDDYNKLGDKCSKHDSVWNKVAYSSFRSKYYGIHSSLLYKISSLILFFTTIR